MKEALKRFLGKVEKEDYYSPDESEGIIKTPKSVKFERDFAIEKFKTRRSIRKYSPKEVEWKCIYNIIEASLNAPCAGNIQNTHIIVIEDKKLIQEIAKAESQQYWIADASIVLAVIREDTRLEDLYPNNGKKYSIQHTAAVIENILMLAHFHDYGACWVESCENEVLKELLGVPLESVVDAIIPIGFPLENPQVEKCPITERVFFDKYGQRKR